MIQVVKEGGITGLGQWEKRKGTEREEKKGRHIRMSIYHIIIIISQISRERGRKRGRE